MSGAKVDVLAGIRLAAKDCRAQGNSVAELELLGIAGAVADLIEVSSALLAFRIGEYPRLGYLPDNDVTRAQLDALAAALSNIGPQS